MLKIGQGQLIIETYFVLPYIGMVATLIKYPQNSLMHTSYEISVISEKRKLRYVCDSPNKWP